jgi:O-Antigen ligase
VRLGEGVINDGPAEFPEIASAEMPLWSIEVPMIRDALLSIGLLVSTASQLRPAGGKIGPGEACLAIWLLLTGASVAARLGPPLTPVLSRLLLFWIVFALAMCLGTMTGFTIGDFHDPKWFVHDTIAYVLVAAVSCLSVVGPGAWSRLHRVARLLAVFGAAWLALQVAVGWDAVRLEGVEPWTWDRLSGLYENSNQLALVCVVLCLLSLHLAETANNLAETIAALMCLSTAIVVGRLTKSDAFALVLVATTAIFVALKLRTWMLSRKDGLTIRTAAAWLIVLALPVIFVSVIPLGAMVAGRAEDVMQEMTRGSPRETEEHAQLRLNNWGLAIQRGVESGMLGLGPGPHLEIPPSIQAGRRNPMSNPNNREHPQLGLAPNFEAHNTILDLFTQGGLLAVLGILWLFCTALTATMRARLDALAALLCGTAIFSLFHLIVRAPIVWFAIAFCLVAATEAATSSRMVRISPGRGYRTDA